MSQIPALVGGRALVHGIGMHVDHGAGNSAKMYVGGQAATKTAASSTLTNTTDETALDSLAIPANALVAGSTIRVRAMGTIVADTSTPSFQVFLSLGATSTALASREEILASTDAAVSAGDVYYIDALIQVRTVGSSGTAVGMVMYQDPDAVTTATKRALKASFTLNTTVENTLAVSGQWSAAATGNQARSDLFCVDIVNPAT